MKVVDNGRIVAPRSRREVELTAFSVRSGLGLSPGGRVSMQPLLEETLYEVIDGYDFRVRSDRDMRGLYGLTDERDPIIYLSSSVYSALERGEGHARMTAAHEFGHLMLHCGLPTYRAFSDQYEPLYDPERQANIFAAAFLMPEASFRRCATAREAMRKFGVSLDAATCRARKLQHKFLPDRPILSIGKKKGSSKRRTPF
ncbi:ImmA/IrrE family metallo-endopeptidase [Sphingomonas sp. H39-1-10]|uniref:ImmA/IrrE family metallo-endopeptidase n=1 Tax=Sphingomonas pollutisoli TaxID=3030829 RepID=UPI0023B9703F|nr:ImmA/IrrE family metallo-endopeptidase [Sphingomonas pollutisoli]MDF0489226.1 ImmA/IrrE family metallo-endopeptidase [Sphingomonas pollutisoli]